MSEGSSAHTVPAPVHALLADGTTVQIRQARPGDLDAVGRLHEDMSPENLRFRFFAPSRRSARQAASRICAPPRAGFRALVAVHGDQVVGVAEYDTAGGAARPGAAAPDSAEIAIAVADGWHHRGVGTLLLEHLVDTARADGIRVFEADTLADNHGMLKVFADLGLRLTTRLDGTEVRCVVRLDQDEHYLSAVDARASLADVASLRPLLRPRSVAVIGAGRSPGSVGRAILGNLLGADFAGQLFLVHPEADVILGLPAHRSVALLPTAPDLAVIAVPAGAVPAVAEQCGRRGARSLLVVTSGLDAGQAGELLGSCRRHSMRLAGPNCLGMANTDREVRLDATFAAARPAAGSAGVAVQSGGVGIALLGGLSRLGIGVSTFVSLGDKYDVSGNDLLQWWESDGRTDLAVLHLESFGNPRAFSRTARRVAREMPILTVDAGRSQEGRRAAASHTAAAATPTVTRQALFRQAGVIATRSIGELLETAALLHAQPLPEHGRVAIVSNAGGSGVLAADACVEAGLTVPALGAAVAEELVAGLPPGAVAANPVDTTAAATARHLGASIDRLMAERSVDAVLVSLVPTALAAGTPEDPLHALTGSAGAGRKPLVAVLPDQDTGVRLLETSGGARVPAYADPQSAARALRHATERTRWLAQPRGTVPELDGIDTDGATAAVESFLATRPDGGWLDPARCADLLGRYGIPQVAWAWAENEESAVTAALRLAGSAGRVALKAYWPGLVHKTEHGAVRLDLAGEAQVRAAYRDLAGRFGDSLAGVVVQAMAPRGLELFAGVVQDQVFGPLVLFGLGGTATEVLADHAARLAPLTDQDVRALIGSPRCAPLLLGHRGGEPVDLAGLEQLLLRLSRLACDLPQLAEADLNPVMATSHGVLAVDARVRLVPRRAHDPYLRRLR